MFKKIVLTLLLGISLLFSSNLVFAGDLGKFDNVYDGTGEKPIAGEMSSGVLSQKTLPEIIGTGIRILLGLLGTVALVFVIMSGIEWMTSQGDKTKITAARERMITAAVGMVIIAASYAIADFAIKQIMVIAG